MLQVLGLSAAEEAAYRDLVDRGAATVEDLPRRWACTAETADALLAALAAKDLVVRHPGLPPLIAAAPPDIALGGLALEREESLRHARGAIAALTARYRQVPHGDPAELIETVTGLDAVLRRWERLQRDARREVRGFDRPPYGQQHNELELELLGRGIGYRSIYQPASLDGRLDHITHLLAAGEQARVLPDLPLKLMLIDDRYALVPLHVATGHDSAVVIHPSPLLEALSWLFELAWERSAPISPDGAPAPAAVHQNGAPSSDERRLLTLLTAGVTDTAIAHHLGWSNRTTSRRLAALLARLDADTRFQAGVQASRRGWI